MPPKLIHMDAELNSLSPPGRRRPASSTGVAKARLDTPLGPMTALVTDRGLAGLWFDGQKHHPGVLVAPDGPEHPTLIATARWLNAYWARTGEREPTPTLDLTGGTPFQRAVWAALLSIPPGTTSTYAVMAAAAGSPAAVRAAGAAIGRNPISLIVPCHRVLGSGGALTGYAGGLERKRALLAHEGAALA